MISIDGLAVEFGGTTLFSDVSFVINEKDRIALMGKNGAGKSTLLKILAGVRQPTRGKISAPKDSVIAYLPQHLMTEDGRTVFQETAQAFSHLHEMEAEIERLNKELETRTDYESDSYMELIETVSALSEKFYSIDATNYEEDVEKALLGPASAAKISTARPVTSAADGVCASSLPNYCCKSRMYCYWMSLPTTSTSKVFSGWKISLSIMVKLLLSSATTASL